MDSSEQPTCPHGYPIHLKSECPQCKLESLQPLETQVASFGANRPQATERTPELKPELPSAESLEVSLDRIENYPPDFVEALNEPYRVLKATLEHSPENLRAFPMKKVTNKVGEQFTLQPYLVSFGRGDITGRMIMYLLNDRSEVVGQRVANLDNNYFSNEAPYSVSGNVTIGQRGKGLHYPTERGFTDILQEISNESQADIEWVVANNNLSKLKNIQASEQSTEVLISEKEEEQKRWQSVYSRFGLKDLGEGIYSKIIHPKGVQEKLSSTEDEKLRATQLERLGQILEQVQSVLKIQSIPEGQK